MVQVIASFHNSASSAAADSTLGSADTVDRWSAENFQQIEKVFAESKLPDYFNRLKEWCRASFDRLRPTIEQRKHDGFVRECHGDLHLANLAFLNGQATAFDCIEFNDALRWIDTMNEVAFVVMDLDARGYLELAWRFLNRYLSINGDYSGLVMLPYYVVYRALVHSKVEVLRVTSMTNYGQLNKEGFEQSLHFMNLAQSWSCPESPLLITMHGLSGSGKSTIAENLASAIGAIQIRSDIERKRPFGLKETSSSDSSIDVGIYNHEASVQTYIDLVR